MCIPKTTDLSLLCRDKYSRPICNRRRRNGAFKLTLIRYRTIGGLQTKQLAAHGADHHELSNRRRRGFYHLPGMVAPQLLTGSGIQSHQRTTAEADKEPTIGYGRSGPGVPA